MFFLKITIVITVTIMTLIKISKLRNTNLGHSQYALQIKSSLCYSVFLVYSQTSGKNSTKSSQYSAETVNQVGIRRWTE